MGTSKHRNTSNMKNQNNLSPKIASPILMIPDQNDIGKIPDADFKRMSINIAKRKKKNNSKGLQYFQRPKQLSEIKKSILNTKIEVSKEEIEIMKKFQAE